MTAVLIVSPMFVHSFVLSFLQGVDLLFPVRVPKEGRKTGKSDGPAYWEQGHSEHCTHLA